MTQELYITLVIIGTLSSVVALLLPGFHVAVYDKPGRLRSMSGLWREVVQLNSNADGSFCKKLKNCDNNPDCQMTLEGKCKSKDELCATSHENSCGKGSVQASCAWDSSRSVCRHKNEVDNFGNIWDTVGDISFPWSKENGKGAEMTWARICAITAVSLGVISALMATVPNVPQPMIASITALGAGGSIFALLIIYGASLAPRAFATASGNNTPAEKLLHMLLKDKKWVPSPDAPPFKSTDYGPSVIILIITIVIFWAAAALGISAAMA